MIKKIPSVSLERRSQVSFFEKLLEKGIADGTLEDAQDACTLNHYFTPVIKEYGCGVYARELTMPKGAVIIGKLHRHPHLAFLSKGKLIIISEAIKETIEAPYTFVSPVGAKRAFYVLEEALLTTVHLTKEDSEEALEAIEDEVIAENYTELGLEEPDLTLFDIEVENMRNLKWRG